MFLSGGVESNWFITRPSQCRSSLIRAIERESERDYRQVLGVRGGGGGGGETG